MATWLVTLLASLFASKVAGRFDRPINVDPALDCAIKNLAWEYARKLQPYRGGIQPVFDALQLQSCNISSFRPAATSRSKNKSPRLTHHSAPAITIYADSVHGRDTNRGTIDSPVQSLVRAVELTRQVSPGKVKQIYLRGGTFYLEEPIELGVQDSFLTISGYEREHAIVSGGREYQFTWKQYKMGMGPNLIGTSLLEDTSNGPGRLHVKLANPAKVSDVKSCRRACEEDKECIAFTFQSSTSPPSSSKSCFLRTGGVATHSRCPYCVSGKKLNIVYADLSSQNPNSFTSLFIDGRRAVRARYPDGNPETMGLHTNPTGYVDKAEKWLPPKSYPPATEIHIKSPQRNGTKFPTFEIGIGGPVEAFDPPESYWGLKKPVGGGAATYEITTGLVYSSDVGFVNRTWSRPDTGVVHAFHCRHWGNWQFKLSDRNMSKRELIFAYGGFQEARGCKSGAEWYVENIFEELDSPGEWYYNETEEKLYFYPNGSLPHNGIGSVMDTLFSVRGTMESPVLNVTLMNIELAHTATTFLEGHEVPSGGDWAVQRKGTVLVEGAINFVLQNCLLNAPGGNGLCLSNYVRNAVIQDNEIVWSGASGIVSLGSADLLDGTLGTQPRGTQILRNLIHENGVYGKQTASYMQALSCQTELVGNVFFNGPRGGINFNDGFGGGNLLKNNLVFNHVRETTAHGPFNSWDRLPYLTKVKNEDKPSLYPAQSTITRNFLISNYLSTWPLDHDDGSSFYNDTYNFLIYGGYKGSNGHGKKALNNIYVYPDAIHASHFFRMPYCAVSWGATATKSTPASWHEVWANNTCITGSPNVYEFAPCNTQDADDMPITANNTFYAPKHFIYIECHKANLTLEEYQRYGFDLGSVVLDPVGTDVIVKWGRDILNF